MDDIEQQQPPDVLTSDTSNATQIKPSEAPPHRREKFQRFRAYNRGLWNGPKRENKEEVHRQDDLHRLDAITSSLDLTDHQQSAVRRVFDEIELNHYTTSGVSVDGVIFAISVVVANYDAPGDQKRYWPHPQTTGNDELFEEVAADLSLDYGTINGLVQRISQTVSL